MCFCEPTDKRVLMGNPKAFHLRNTLDQLSSNSWDFYRKANALDFSPREETLTENLIISLKEKHPQDVTIKKFTSTEEITNGADWIWCFRDSSNRVLHVSIVQAKKLYIESMAYKQLNYKTQSYDIMNSARKYGISSQFLLFNFVPTEKLKVPKDFHWGTPNHLMGCTVLPEHKFDLIAISKDFYELNKFTTPLRCMICPCAYSYLTTHDLSVELQELLGLQMYYVNNHEVSPQLTKIKRKLELFGSEGIEPKGYDDIFGKTIGVVYFNL